MYLRVLICCLMFTFGFAPAAPAANLAGGQFRYANTPDPFFQNEGRSAQQNQYVIIQSWETDLLHRLKAANPNLKVLAHKNLAFVPDGWPTFEARVNGVSMDEAKKHPDWFLRDTAGKPIKSNGYDYLNAMDVGNPGYQRAWAAGIAAELRKQPWDGVFFDDTNTTFRYHADVDSVAKYPNDRAYQQAVGSMLAQVRPTITSSGKVAMANIGSWSMYPDVAKSWLNYLDGGMDEMFTKWDSGPGEGFQGEAEWKTQQAALRDTQARGKVYLGVSHSTQDDSRATRYGYGSLLLNGQGKAFFSQQGDYKKDPSWIPDFDWDLGSPRGGAVEDPSGTHRRLFSNGLVVVNPTDRDLNTDLGGNYLDASGRTVSSLRLQSKSAVVLRRTGGTPVGKPAAKKAKPSCAKLARKVKGGKRKKRAYKSFCVKLRSCRATSAKASKAKNRAVRKRAAKRSAKMCSKARAAKRRYKKIR